MLIFIIFGVCVLLSILCIILYHNTWEESFSWAAWVLGIVGVFGLLASFCIWLDMYPTKGNILESQYKREEIVYKLEYILQDDDTFHDSGVDVIQSAVRWNQSCAKYNLYKDTWYLGLFYNKAYEPYYVPIDIDAYKLE